MDDTWEVLVNRFTGEVAILPPFVGFPGGSLLAIAPSRAMAEEYATRVADRFGYRVIRYGEEVPIND